jgi:hypothetical protein
MQVLLETSTKYEFCCLLGCDMLPTFRRSLLPIDAGSIFLRHLGNNLPNYTCHIPELYSKSSWPWPGKLKSRNTVHVLKPRLMYSNLAVSNYF